MVVISENKSGQNPKIATSCIEPNFDFFQTYTRYGDRGGSRSKSQIFLLRTYYDIWIMRELDLFTESKNFARLLIYDAWKLVPTRAILGFCMEKTPKN